jgi:hypothetical protein
MNTIKTAIVPPINLEKESVHKCHVALNTKACNPHTDAEGILHLEIPMREDRRIHNAIAESPFNSDQRERLHAVIARLEVSFAVEALIL